MNMLIDLLPESVDIEGIEYTINTDFRVGVLFEELMQDSSLLDEEKLMMALNLYYDDIPLDTTKAVERLQWFYRCGKEKTEAVGNGDSNKADNIYSFQHDDDYIYSAFLTQYNIDLQDVEDLHWWKFKAMFKSLKEDNKISKIMGYRSISIKDDMSNEDKKFYRDMKRIYTLPDLRSEEEKEIDFHESLSNVL